MKIALIIAALLLASTASVSAHKGPLHIKHFARPVEVITAPVMNAQELDNAYMVADTVQQGFLRDSNYNLDVNIANGTFTTIFPYASGSYGQAGTANSFVGIAGTDVPGGGVNPLRTDSGNGILNVTTGGQNYGFITVNGTCTLFSGSTGKGRLYELINSGAAQTVTITIVDSTTVCTDGGSSQILYGPVIIGQGQVIKLDLPYSRGLMYLTSGAPTGDFYIVRQ